MLVQSG